MEQGVFAFAIAEIQIAQTIAIKIAGRHAGAADRVVMFGDHFLGDHIGPGNAGFLWRKRCESSLSVRGNVQSGPAKSVSPDPVGRPSRTMRQDEERHNESGREVTQCESVSQRSYKKQRTGISSGPRFNF
jgi:hypothetical protein